MFRSFVIIFSLVLSLFVQTGNCLLCLTESCSCCNDTVCKPPEKPACCSDCEEEEGQFELTTGRETSCKATESHKGRCMEQKSFIAIVKDNSVSITVLKVDESADTETIQQAANKHFASEHNNRPLTDFLSILQTESVVLLI